MTNDIYILRELAKKYAQAAADPVNTERAILHRAVNDLKPIRPVVLIDEVPWNEFSAVEALQNQCHDPWLRRAEQYLRQKLYQWEYFPADMILLPYFPVTKIVHTTGIGLEIEETTISADPDSPVASHGYEDLLSSPEQLELLRPPVITYDQEMTMDQCNRLSEIFTDILPVRPVGREFHIHPWDDIVCYRGLTNLLIDLIEEPEFMHTTIRKMAEILKSSVDQYEALNLFEPNQLYNHSTSALNSTLPPDGYDPEQVKMSDVWGRGAAQVFANVSADMHEEFDIQYTKELMKPFGLNYYGCCEPLHNKLHIVEQIPNLRKVSISPWADTEKAAEISGLKYVLGTKPNPAVLAMQNLTAEAVRQDIVRITEPCQRYHSAYDIVLKDISTIMNKPENLIRWERETMKIVRGL